MEYQFNTYQETPLLQNHLHMGGSNPQGETIAVTSRYLTRGGTPWIGVMGEFHFSRYDRQYWYRELCKMKAGGISIVATYLFWIYHEEVEGEFNFSGDCDIRAFVEECRRADLDVILRIGPWAHGECRNGGFPDWLLKKPYRLRDNNEGYLAKTRIWYQKIYEQIQGLLYQDGGNIIGIQLENELVNGAEHLKTLKEIAVETGFHVPLYTVTGWNSRFGAKIPVDEVLPVFGAYPEAPWTSHTDPLPPSHNFVFSPVRNDSAVGTDIIKDTDEDGWRLPYERYPFATCELGAGQQATHHRRPIISGMDAYALSLVKLGSGNNLVGYYMYHGGTNQIGKYSTFNESKATGYPNDYPILNYDFQTALSQYGEAREQYRLLNLLHLFVQDFGSILAPMELTEAANPETDPSNFTSLRYCMRTNGRAGFVFINHYQRLATMAPLSHVILDTGIVRFPEISVDGDMAFFLPFHMEIADCLLEYATAQPLCRVGNTYFFTALHGISPEYKFVGSQAVAVNPGFHSAFSMGEARIVTLTWEQVLRTRKLSGKLYVGVDCDVYEENGDPCAIEDGSFSYMLWTGDHFSSHRVERPFRQAQAAFEPLETAPFVPAHGEELCIGGPRKQFWKKITVSGDEGFIEIPDICDAEQIYADGKLVADDFYYGKPWRIPARLLYGKECYLVMSQWKDDFYREF